MDHRATWCRLFAALASAACAASPRSDPPAGGRPPAPSGSAVGGAPAGVHVASTTVPVPGACDLPRTGRADSVGCHAAGAEPLGPVRAMPLFRHLDAYPTRDAAEEARRARGAPRGTVTEAHGRVWLFTIAEDAWRPEAGERVARVGPLPLIPGRNYTAYYIEGAIPPGARTPAHRRAGPEAWYFLQATNCLLTLDGTRTAGPGERLIVPEGPPMVLTGVGPTVRRLLAAVVHDAAAHWTIPAPEWTPTGTCAG